MEISLQFTMAQTIARKILEHSGFSEHLREQAKEFTSDKTREYWLEQSQRWETDSLSWQAIRKLRAEWEGKL